MHPSIMCCSLEISGVVASDTRLAQRIENTNKNKDMKTYKNSKFNFKIFLTLLSYAHCAFYTFELTSEKYKLKERREWESREEQRWVGGI